MTVSIVGAFDELERRRREEYAALREWLVRVTARHDAPIGSGSLAAPVGAAHGVGDGPDLFDKATVARRLDVSLRTLERRIARGELVAVREGGMTKVRRSDLERYVADLECRVAMGDCSVV